MDVENYWMRFTGLMDCDERFTKAHQVAVLHYTGAPQQEPQAAVGYNVHAKTKLVSWILDVNRQLRNFVKKYKNKNCVVRIIILSLSGN